MPTLLWTSAVGFSLLFALILVSVLDKVPFDRAPLLMLAVPLPFYLVLLLFGLAYLASKIKRLEQRFDD